MPYPPLQPADAAQFETAKNELRRRIPALNQYPDDYIWRFLKARAYDVEKAAKMLSDNWEWRNAEQIDNILSEYFPPETNQLYVSGYHGRDRRGNVLRIERPGLSNPGESLGKYGFDAALRWHCAVMETGRKTFESYMGGTGDGCVVIMDMTGLGMKHMDRKAVSFIRCVAALDHANYPEFLRQVFLVNAPTLFTGLYKLISPFIDPNTRAKVTILGKDFMSTVSQYIDPSQLPDFLGGSCTYCPGGCLSSCMFGGKDPSKPFLRVKSRYNTQT